MNKMAWRNGCISVFVVVWLVFFHYQSLRHFYIAPWAQKHFDVKLEPTPWLFPPAGWIMFFQVGESTGSVEVYGVKDGQPQLLDPHDILPVKTIMFDNIHRGILGNVLTSGYEQAFCGYLKRKFGYFDEFWVTAVHYPSVTQTPYQRYQRVMYTCR